MSTPPLPTMSAPPPPPTATGGNKARRGCLIALLVVVLLLMAGCGGACYYAVRHPGRAAAFGMGLQRDQMVAAVASSATEQQKADFATEYDAYVSFLRGLDFATMQGLAADKDKLFAPVQFLGEAAKDKQFTPDEVDRFIELARGARSLIK